MEEDKNNNENNHLDYNSKNENIKIQGEDIRIVNDMVMSSEVLTKYMQKAQDDVFKKAKEFIDNHREINDPEELGKLYDKEWDRENEKQDKENIDLSDDMEQ